MRLLITLTPNQDTPHPLAQEHLQSAIYSIFRSIGQEEIHDSPRYKYFCFSNIFPYIKGERLIKDSSLNWMISSPKNDLIEKLYSFFSYKPELRFGIYNFKVAGSKLLHISINQGYTLISGTPIVATIPMKLFEKYGIKSDRDSIEWNNTFALNAFIDLVSHNLIRKYNRFYGTSLSEDLVLFRQFKYKGFAVVPYKKGKLNGTNWELSIDTTNELLNPVYQLGLDSGLGDHSSAGFGFMNIKK